MIGVTGGGGGGGGGGGWRRPSTAAGPPAPAPSPPPPSAVTSARISGRRTGPRAAVASAPPGPRAHPRLTHGPYGAGAGYLHPQARADRQQAPVAMLLLSAAAEHHWTGLGSRGSACLQRAAAPLLVTPSDVTRSVTLSCMAADRVCCFTAPCKRFRSKLCETSCMT